MVSVTPGVVFVFLMIINVSRCLPVFIKHQWERRGLLSGHDDVPPKPSLIYNQLLDHFTPSSSPDLRQWNQRYWINDSYWDRVGGGPVFLMIEGEGEADPKWIMKGEMMDLVMEYKGLAVQVEHRFYGKSQPTGDWSIDSLKYLSSHQAIEDLVDIVQYLKDEYKMSPINRWIAFGGSYSGALAAWIRILHPDVVYGAVATSAPVYALFDFNQYLEVIGKSLSQARNGDQCVSAIQEAFTLLDKMILDKTQWPHIESIFNMSSKLSSLEDGKLLSMSLAGIFMNVVQYNGDNRGAVVYDMNVLCDVMTNDSLGHSFDRLVYLSLTYNLLDSNDSTSFDAYLRVLSNSTVSFSQGDRQWFYQTCSEFGYFQTTDSPNQPFGSLISIDLYTIVCQRVFNISQSQTISDINSTNKVYGGRDINSNVTNIIFPNGSIDPWHALSIIEDKSSSIIAVFINGTAHCANMYPSSPHDIPELVKARQDISRILGSWLAAA